MRREETAGLCLNVVNLKDGEKRYKLATATGVHAPTHRGEDISTHIHTFISDEASKLKVAITTCSEITY